MTKPLVLAIDTSGEDAGIALATGGRTDVAYLPLGARGVARTEDLAFETASLLHAQSLAPGDLTLVAAVVGPGSYTGLRSGLAFLRGLAFGQALPAVGVGTLELLAWRGAADGESVIAATPAGAGRFAVATCTRAGAEITGDTAPQIVEAGDFGDFLTHARGAGNVAMVIGGSAARGDAAREALEAAAASAGIATRSPQSSALEALVVVAEARALGGAVIRVDELLPLYVGQSSARPNRHRVAIADAAQ